ncbi:MAG: AAA family ATPase [Actinobacteria bacterium]|nr:AAA family ATPase [Actinomycetota bacterium]
MLPQSAETGADVLERARPGGDHVPRRPAPSVHGSFTEVFTAIAGNVEQVVRGKPEVVELVLLGLVAEGHVLIEDVPGVGKTSLAKALATSLDCRWGRIQFTPDLLPADVVGGTVWNRASGEFDFRPGPVFANLVLADEINRASPKTQSALLEAMEERQVTVDATTYPLDAPFMVLATQNPVEHDGTYPLPQSQLDRFLLRVTVGYPRRDSEIKILGSDGGADALDDLEPVATAKDVVEMAATARRVHVAPSLQGYLVDVAETSRRHPALALGMSPRATLALQRVARARAAASGRTYVVPDDVKALAPSVVAHRLGLTPEAQMQGVTSAEVIDDVLRRVPVPSGRPER